MDNKPMELKLYSKRNDGNKKVVTDDLGANEINSLITNI